MNERGKSDGPVVPKKLPNEAQAEEAVEERGPAKGNLRPRDTSQAQDWSNDVQSKRKRIREAAAKDKRLQFTSLLHHVYDLEALRKAYLGLKRRAAAGVDGETWQAYGKDLESNLRDLSARLKRGGYRAKPVRRTYIPKSDGRPRPLGITSLEDKVVQAALVAVLNAIYETDFLGFSYGFRPGRHQHKALDAVTVGVKQRNVNWVLDADIRGFFDNISHEWLAKFVEHRIADKRVVRLIQKWLKAGVLEEDRRIEVTEGTPQGGVVSPLLANIYLHYAFDLWADQWRRRHARGDVIIVRYADDIVVGFEDRATAEQFLSELRERFAKFNLELNADKTRLIEFGRSAARNRRRRGEGKPETFDFLGFTHICGETKKGRFQVKRRTIRKRLRGKLKEVKADLLKRLHRPVPETGKWLRDVVVGHGQYYGVPGNSESLNAFREEVTRHWKRSLERRSQKGRLTWLRMRRLVRKWLPRIRICHPYPEERLVV